jgi:hypothetical protein
MVLYAQWRKLQAQSVQEIKTNAGLYFDEMGTVSFYPSKWKVITYVNLEPTRELWRQTEGHQRKIADFCKKIKNRNWYHYTDCVALDQYLTSKNKYIDNLKDLLTEYMPTETRNTNRRTKRGVMNFVGFLKFCLEHSHNLTRKAITSTFQN